MVLEHLVARVAAAAEMEHFLERAVQAPLGKVLQAETTLQLYRILRAVAAGRRQLAQMVRALHQAQAAQALHQA